MQPRAGEKLRLDLASEVERSQNTEDGFQKIREA